MAQFPQQFAFPIPPIHITSIGSLSAVTASPIMFNVPASFNYPSANLALFFPFRITAPYTFSTAFWINGSTAAANIDIGVYSEDGTKLASTGSTAQGGAPLASLIQSTSITTTTIGPGLFYLAVSLDAATSGLFASNSVWTANFEKVCGVAQMASAFPLPATATLATVANVYVPLFGVTGRSFV